MPRYARIMLTSAAWLSSPSRTTCRICHFSIVKPIWSMSTPSLLRPAANGRGCWRSSYLPVRATGCLPAEPEVRSIIPAPTEAAAVFRNHWPGPKHVDQSRAAAADAAANHHRRAASAGNDRTSAHHCLAGIGAAERHTFAGAPHEGGLAVALPHPPGTLGVDEAEAAAAQLDNDVEINLHPGPALGAHRRHRRVMLLRQADNLHVDGHSSTTALRLDMFGSRAARNTVAD